MLNKFCKAFLSLVSDSIYPTIFTLSIGHPNYTERKKKRRVNFIPKFHSSLKKFVKYFTMITKRYMYRTKVPNFIGLWSTSLELLKFIVSYPPNLEIKLKINIGQYGKPKFRAKQACLNLQHKISSHHLVPFNDTQRSSILLPIFLFIFTLLWTFFQSWYDWLMFRGVGQLRCWCRVRGNSKLPIILGTSQQLNVLLDV